MFNLFKPIGIFVILMLFFASSVSSETAHKEQLLEALQSRNVDRVTSILNDIKSSRYQGDVLPLLERLWNKDLSGTTISSDFVELDIIRISISDVLVQAHMNGLIKVEISQIQDFARSRLNVDDAEVISMAATVLSQIDDPADAAALKAIAIASDGYVFNSTVTALALMCNTAARDALSAIEGILRDSTKKAYVAESRRKFGNLKTMDGFCRDGGT